MVEHERDADHRQPAGERSLERHAEMPALRRARLEERIRAGRTLRIGIRRSEQRGGPAVQHRLGGAHDEDELGLDERAIHPERRLRRVVEHGELGVLGVVDDDVTVEAAGEVARDEPFELALRRPPRKAARDEDRLVAARDSEPLELVDHRADRKLARIGRAARDRQCGRLDDDRRSPASAHERLERLSFEREAERVAYRRADVRDAHARRRRTEHDRVVRRGRDDELRACE